ncbi:DUF6402 family protein [Neisseria sp. Dent CA1/247]|uniref:DUF6402 family protein n=1 Tax=Neisseria sp. Dent CA1/247 TaxID=2912675 RepID=UPI001FD5586A|nr:DUF6402 family protein [Neisseria sp. Dent CA1/247]UOO77139.1 DUF6402 family protein [Neisseria sp. Dent CA1/247]
MAEKTKFIEVYTQDVAPRKEGEAVIVKIECNPMLVCKAKVSTPNRYGGFPKQDIPLNRFKLRDIATVMRNHGWHMGAKAQDAWFEGDYYEFTKEQKEENSEILKDPEAMKKGVVQQDFVTWEWLDKSPLIMEKFRELVRKSIYKDIAKAILKRKIEDSWRKIPKDNFYKQAAENILKYHTEWQFQHIKIGDSISEKPIRHTSIEDWFVAFGSFSLCAAPYQIILTHKQGNLYRAKIPTIAVYAKDTYDYVGEQFLGFWNAKGVRIFADGVLDNLQAARGKELNSLKVTTPFLDGDNIHTDLFLPVNNSDFRRWRETTNQGKPKEQWKGRDMLLFSKILPVPTPDFEIEVEINK